MRLSNFCVMRKKIFILGLLGVFLSTTSCASLYVGRGCKKDYDAFSYKEGKVVATLVANGVYKKSKTSTISVAYLLIENGDVAVIAENERKIVLPFTKDEAKIIMMHGNNECVEVIYPCDK